jgi:hypothetical protein
MFNNKNIFTICILILFTFVGLRLFDLNAPWKRMDHYNWGGVHHTMVTECFQKYPLEITRGVAHFSCEDEEQMQPYPNWPPLTFLALAEFRNLIGTTEPFATRFFFFIFSVLNLVLCFQIAREFFKSNRDALIVTTLHSLTFYTLLYSTHSDFISDFSSFFFYAAILLALKNQNILAGFGGMVAGMISWGGFFFFPAWFIYLWRKKDPYWKVVFFAWGPLAALLGLFLMSYLHRSSSLYAFLYGKLYGPSYIDNKLSLTYPIEWAYTFFQTQARFLSPAFLFLMGLGFVSLFRRTEPLEKQDKLLLILLPGLIYALLAHQYVYIHSFHYHPLWIGFSLLTYLGLKKCFQFHFSWSLKVFLIFALLVFPYGKYQNSFPWDVANSLLILTSVVVLFLSLQRKSEMLLVSAIAITSLSSASRFLNFRSESPKDFLFCQKARAEFAMTDQPVKAEVPPHFTRNFYCRGIKILDE